MAKTNKSKLGMSLHHFIASGGNPKDFQTTKGISSATVNNIKKSSKK